MWLHTGKLQLCFTFHVSLFLCVLHLCQEHLVFGECMICVYIYYALYHTGGVKSRVFLHHFMAAVENLDPGERDYQYVACDLVSECCPYLSFLKRTDLVHTHCSQHVRVVLNDSFTLCSLPALNCSLALVSCDGHPDVCAQYNITTYPSVRVFDSSHISSTPITGALDSAYLLSALGQHTLSHHQSKTVVRE